MDAKSRAKKAVVDAITGNAYLDWNLVTKDILGVEEYFGISFQDDSTFSD